MDVNERLRLLTRNLEEVVTLEELKSKVSTGEKLKGYIGFEPSGPFHLGWLIWARKLSDMQKAGVQMNVLIATWHAWINDKMGGDMDKIKLVGKYTIEVLGQVGVDTASLKVLDAENFVEDKEYWKLVLNVAKNTSLARMKRAMTIMGRKAEEAELDTSKLIYPAMQVSDIFYMDLDLALGGIDQRKAHMLARDVADKLGKKKVIGMHVPLLVGLQGGSRMNLEEDEALSTVKMSKSKPETAIFVHDSPEEVERKIKMAYCPAGQVDGNPILGINRYIIFGEDGETLTVERPAKYGGDVKFESYEELERAYVDGKVHPLDLKAATARKVNQILEPVRKHLSNRSEFDALIRNIVSNVTR
ncbi:tyrosine--tRNA ligase [Sulfodiicoccus acidiphilus]|uniref:Tyrosine--tRNA ligase n=1 Tax=Sulfodiicoccus acidiphilus TaxID=1670455 RepID=A0A348B6Y0_9CREN|nr:tyrosine--tRNA ligase [Sulfodiicoccus acidiphilus]BBD73932.1 tyrosine--tRNA ligase [Sulfodiicoccus acidiphilus]GGU03295.1 tyrosine--tRNA ligase [Sulfodiicoccus acidiphilus]